MVAVSLGRASMSRVDEGRDSGVGKGWRWNESGRGIMASL